MKGVFNKAIEYGYVETNPFRRLKKIREEEKRLYMRTDEVRKLLEKLADLAETSRNRSDRAMYAKFRQFCEVLLQTGLRRSELLTLQVDQVDLERNVLMIEKAKGRKRREVPMTSRVREILIGLQPMLFRDMTKDQVSHTFTRLAKALGFTGLKLHSLSHTFGTYLIGMGYDVTVVRDLLGHEDIRTTVIYAKADPARLRDAIRSFEKLGGDGYKMVTEGGDGNERATYEK